MDNENENIVESQSVKKEYLLQKIISIDSDTKKDIALSIVEIGTLTKLYWFSLALSAVIATLGLLQNSIPVVIGVMLIAPLLRPIQSFSFAIINAQYGAVWRAFKELGISVILVVSISMLITAMIPIQLETSEIIARTNPNILDFFIAGASAVIAFLALVYPKKLSVSIAGVAMAASLLPPLSVVGIELMYQHYHLAWGSFLLFVANIIAIITVGILLFFIFGFKPHQEEDKEKFKMHILILMLILSVISLPLFLSIINLSQIVKEKNYIQESKKEIFGDKLEFSDIKIKNIYGNKKTEIILEGNFYGNDFTNLNNKVAVLKNKIDEKFQINSNIELRMIQMVNLFSDN